MNFELKSLDVKALWGEKQDALVVMFEASFKPGRDVVSSLIAKALKANDLESKAGQMLSVYRPAGFACTWLWIACMGDGGASDVRKAVASVTAGLMGHKSRRVTFALLNAPDPVAIRMAVAACADVSYVYTETKSNPERRTLKEVVLAVPDAEALQSEFDLAVGAAKGVELAKHWGNLPGNVATPTKLAEAARALSSHPKIKCKVFGPKEVSALGMGAFEAVAKGSAEPLRFIELHYNGAGKSDAPIVLVGKGITFDSGGISIKPAAEMDEMKFDMCGAASVLGVFRALSELQPKINVVGLIPACENLPGGSSVKPGDVVKSMSGQTIEILNTDAEGRLVLCDALTYAERFKPRAVIDIATLTGACVVALGGVRSGLFCGDPSLSAALVAASESSQDLCWPMPLDDEYAEGLKTNFADVANVAGRSGGAVSAAKFLQRFTKKFIWAHLDIAGTAWKSGTAKGATGRPVGLLVAYLIGQAAAGARGA